MDKQHNNENKKMIGQLIKDPSGYQYYMPSDIFNTLSLSLPLSINKQLEQASFALGRYSFLLEKMPDLSIFTALFHKKEATLTSRIEGIQTTIKDVFINEEDIPTEKRDDWAEVHCYIKSLEATIKALEKMPLCNRIIKDAHRTLLSQPRGQDKLPGEFRTSQNWIGGSRPDNAHFVPPAPHHVIELMGQLEKFINADNTQLPELVKIALIHYQFETIHPFLDGNGRIGRMLIPLYLMEKKIIEHPILFVSDFLEKNRSHYYSALDKARNSENGLINWISFFIDVIEKTANSGIAITQNLIEYQTELRERKLPQHFGRLTAKSIKLLEILFEQVIINSKALQLQLKFSPQVSNKLLNEFVKLGILKEITGGKRNRFFYFERYIQILHYEDDE